MTDLLDPPDTRTTAGSASGDRQRSLAVGAAVAGLASSLLVMVGCMVVGLAGWFASDAGGHGTTRDALRVGTDAWLLAQGAHLHLATAGASVSVTAVPLGLTLLCAYVAHRFGRWAGDTSVAEDARALLLGVVVLSGVYGLVALVASLLASTAAAQPSLLGSFAGGFLVALVGGGTGLLRSGRDVLDWRSRVPEACRAVAFGAGAAALLLVACASLLLAVALLLDLGSAANVLSRLHAGVSGGLLYTGVVAAVAPNTVLLAGSYLLGTGFAVGSGTLVSPTVVTLGPVPAFPLLAALPAPGAQPVWLSGLVAAPVLAAVMGVALMLRRSPASGYRSGAVRGLAAGVGGGVLVTVGIALAGGSVGPGRMADIGAGLLDTVLAATLSMGVGGLVAGVVTTWWARRH